MQILYIPSCLPTALTGPCVHLSFLLMFGSKETLYFDRPLYREPQISFGGMVQTANTPQICRLIEMIMQQVSRPDCYMTMALFCGALSKNYVMEQR